MKEQNNTNLIEMIFCNMICKYQMKINCQKSILIE